METRRRGRWPALQLPARLAAVRASVSSAAFPAPTPCTNASRTRGVAPRNRGVRPAPRGFPPPPAPRPPRRLSEGSAAPGCFRTLDRGGAAVGARRLRDPSRPSATSRRPEGGVVLPGPARSWPLSCLSPRCRAGIAHRQASGSYCGDGPWFGSAWSPLQRKHPCPCADIVGRARQCSRGAGLMNIERLGQPPPPSSACGLLPVLRTVCTPRRAPTVKRGGRDPGSPCPVLATKSRPCCQKNSPLSLTAFPSSSLPVAGPKAGARDAPGEGCTWDGRHDTVTALDRDRDRLRRAGPDPEPHTALAAILPSAANFARQLGAFPDVLILEESGTGGWRAGSGVAAGRGWGCWGRPGGRRSQGLHKSLFQTLGILSLETEIKRMIPVSGTRRTESSSLGIVRATGLLPEPSPNTSVVLKGRTSEF